MNHWTMIVLVVLLSGCVSEFEDETTLVQEERILAVRGVPAEAAPGALVHYEALVASPNGGAEPRVDFSYCMRARSAEERTGISSSCLQGENLVAIASDATVPADACARFGPNTPPAEGGEPARRPSDADPTGGYHIPVLAHSRSGGGAARSVGFQRIRCDLAGATRNIFEAYHERYHPNLHPRIVEVSITPDEAGGFVISARVPVDAFEDYVVYSPSESALLDAQEQLTAHWFVSTGSLDASRTPIDPRTGRAQVHWRGEASTAVPAQLWLVIRDSRGGSAWGQYVIGG